MTDHARFAIRFDGWYRSLSSVLFLPPSASYVEVQGDAVHVRMGWAFRATFPRRAVVAVSPLARRLMSRGVHGLAGRWLVNGSGQGIVKIDLRPDQRAYVMGIPVRLCQVLVSLEDPRSLQLRLGR